MYNLQKEKGGIIDLEAEKNKYLLSSVSVSLVKRPAGCLTKGVHSAHT